MTPGRGNRGSVAALAFTLMGVGALGAVPPPSTPAAVGAADGIASAAVVERVVVRPDGELTVSWRARSRVPAGCFRLYRVAPGSALQLVGEIQVILGEHTYRMEDLPERAGAVVYHLCYTNESGCEATLGTLLCLEPWFQGRSTATSPAPDLWALVPTVGGVGHPASVALATTEGRTSHGWRPEPESPPPRSASV